jgi:predicted DNA-binding transcriptional regulator AlpA
MKNPTEFTPSHLSVVAHMPPPPVINNHELGLPAEGLVRLPTILKFFPVSRSAWWAGVKSGIYPAAIKISPRCTAWRVQDIRDLLSRFSRKQ